MRVDSPTSPKKKSSPPDVVALLKRIASVRQRTGLSDARLSTIIFGAGNRLRKLKQFGGDMHSGIIERSNQRLDDLIADRGAKPRNRSKANGEENGSRRRGRGG